MATLNEEYETDAQPIPKVHCPSSPVKPIDDNVESSKLLDEDENEEVIDCDRLTDNANKLPNTTGEFIVSGSAVEIANSSGVHFGHKITQKTDISFESATSVVIDRRQWNYITYPSNKVNFNFILTFTTNISRIYSLICSQRSPGQLVVPCQLSKLFKNLIDTDTDIVWPTVSRHCLGAPGLALISIIVND